MQAVRVGGMYAQLVCPPGLGVKGHKGLRGHAADDGVVGLCRFPVEVVYHLPGAVERGGGERQADDAAVVGRVAVE